MEYRVMKLLYLSVTATKKDLCAGTEYDDQTQFK